MNRGEWANLAVFAAIADAGSFTNAGLALGVSASALSHAMRGLETRLGVRLLNRTTRSVAPTEAGELLLARLRPAMEDVAGALEALNAQRDRPSGRVRVSAHRGAAMQAILPQVAAFTDAYPEVIVELVIDDGLVDIVAERFDAGVRHQQRLEGDMISVRISDPQRVALIASPDYLARHPAPVVPQDLMRHRCLNYRYTSSGALHRWRFERGDEAFALDVTGPFVTNDIDVAMEAALRGVGIANVLEATATRHIAAGALVLEEWYPLIPANSLYYSNRRHVGAALRAFIDAVRVPTT